MRSFASTSSMAISFWTVRGRGGTATRPRHFAGHRRDDPELAAAGAQQRPVPRHLRLDGEDPTDVVVCECPADSVAAIGSVHQVHEVQPAVERQPCRHEVVRRAADRAAPGAHLDHGPS